MAAAQPLKIRMVAGLGNPGDEYAETRHNAGFKAIDELARQAGVTYWKNQAGAEVALININDAEEEGGKRQIVLVKPQSYMNTSGGPISKLCREYKIKAEELLVIHDELDIPAGDVRAKVGGGHAGHNGLRSIIDKMGSRDFSRIRTGIGNPPGKMAVADYVLKQLRAREAEDQRAALRQQQSAVAERLQAEREALQAQQSAIEAAYAERLQSQNLAAEAERLLLRQNQQELIALLAGYAPAYNALGQTLGERLAEGFAASLADVTGWFASLAEQVAAAQRTLGASALDAADQFAAAREGVTVNQSNVFNVPVESPSDTARRVAQANEELGLALLGL